MTSFHFFDTESGFRDVTAPSAAAAHLPAGAIAAKAERRTSLALLKWPSDTYFFTKASKVAVRFTF